MLGNIFALQNYSRLTWDVFKYVVEYFVLESLDDFQVIFYNTCSVLSKRVYCDV